VRKSIAIVIAASIFALGVGGGVAGVLATRSHTTVESVRARSYHSVAELAADSTVIAVVRVGGSPVDVPEDPRSHPPMVRSTATVISATAGGRSVTVPTRDSIITIDQVGTREDTESPLLVPGETYLLFLTSAATDGAATSPSYFPTGVWAGIYRRDRTDDFSRVTSELDVLPDHLTWDGLTAALS
jgi:hypothetical protein